MGKLLASLAREVFIVDNVSRSFPRLISFLNPFYTKIGTVPGKTVRASTTCLMLFGDSSAAHLQACTTWEKPPQSSLLLTDSVGQRVLLTADDKGAQVLLGRRRNMGLGQDNSRIALASGDGNAFVHLQGRRQKGALLSLEGLTIFSEDRRKLAEVPSPTPSK
jgi:hypothetical protein